MKTSWFTYLAATSLLAASALAQTPRETESPTSATELSTADRKFIQEAAEGGEAEVSAGKLAQQQGQSQQVKEIGRVLVEDHTKANQDLKKLAAEKGVDLPAQLSQKRQKELSKLEQASGARFDGAFLRHQEKVHKQNIARFEHVAAQSEDEEIKQFAADTLPALRKHLERIQEASSNLEPSGGEASQ